jgi:hypothetical protein
MGKYGPWQPGDDLEWPHAGNLYIKNLVNRDVGDYERSLALSRISQEWLDEMSMMTHPFSDKEKAMMSFIVNMLVEEGPDEKIQSMSSTVGDVQAAVASYIYGSMEYDLGNDRTTTSSEELYASVADQFVLDPRQPSRPPLRQRLPSAVHVYEQLRNVEFELSNTSHGENVMMGRKPELPITDIDLDDSSDRSVWFLGIFIHYTLQEREVRNHFLDTGTLRMRTVINRTVK